MASYFFTVPYVDAMRNAVRYQRTAAQAYAEHARQGVAGFRTDLFGDGEPFDPDDRERYWSLVWQCIVVTFDLEDFGDAHQETLGRADGLVVKTTNHLPERYQRFLEDTAVVLRRLHEMAAAATASKPDEPSTSKTVWTVANLPALGDDRHEWVTEDEAREFSGHVIGHIRNCRDKTMGKERNSDKSAGINAMGWGWRKETATDTTPKYLQSSLTKKTASHSITSK